jgi:hypothetical protein
VALHEERQVELALKKKVPYLQEAQYGAAAVTLKTHVWQLS